jgi:phosphatidylserine synthase
VALAVLSDIGRPLVQVPDILYIPFLWTIAFLMVSMVPFPSFAWVFSNRFRNILLTILFILTIAVFSLFNAWFFWNNLYLGVSLARAGYKSWR